MPFRIQEEEVDSMLKFVFKNIQDYFENHELGQYVEGIKWFEEKTPDAHIKGFRTRYIPAREITICGIPFDFIAAKKKDADNYSVKIIFKQFYGHDDSTYKTVSFLRMAIVKWSSFKKQI